MHHDPPHAIEGAVLARMKKSFSLIPLEVLTATASEPTNAVKARTELARKCLLACMCRTLAVVMKRKHFLKNRRLYGHNENASQEQWKMPYRVERMP